MPVGGCVLRERSANIDDINSRRSEQYALNPVATLLFLSFLGGKMFNII